MTQASIRTFADTIVRCMLGSDQVRRCNLDGGLSEGLAAFYEKDSLCQLLLKISHKTQPADEDQDHDSGFYTHFRGHYRPVHVGVRPGAALQSRWRSLRRVGCLL